MRRVSAALIRPLRGVNRFLAVSTAATLRPLFTAIRRCARSSKSGYYTVRDTPGPADAPLAPTLMPAAQNASAEMVRFSLARGKSASVSVRCWYDRVKRPGAAVASIVLPLDIPASLGPRRKSHGRLSAFDAVAADDAMLPVFLGTLRHRVDFGQFGEGRNSKAPAK
jgi:hypothetical protein